jgi:hypothetical protein
MSKIISFNIRTNVVDTKVVMPKNLNQYPEGIPHTWFRKSMSCCINLGSKRNLDCVKTS